MKKTAIFLVSLLCCVLLTALQAENDYFRIVPKDVELHIPKGFPRPIYNFRHNKLNPNVFVLGRKLFYDPILSRDSTISCSSCHQRLAAFAHFDHALSHGIDGLIGKRNVPALQNLIWKDAFMDDGGVNNLEVQPLNPITNPVEMDQNLVTVLDKLRKNPIYKKDFQKAFGDTAISTERLLKSLAQFTGLMISSNSRYDRFIAGTDTFSETEKRGLIIFRKTCTGCHPEPLFTDNSYRRNGIGPDKQLLDLGRGLITGDSGDNYKFKVPSLRNIERTYPYMHDGRYRKLEDVVNFYSHANSFAPNADKELQMIGQLDAEAQKQLVTFLKTLTDYTFIYDKRFIDPFLK